jgi:hypothetical protein
LQSNRKILTRFGKPAMAVLLTGMILLLDAMAASPGLHELIHKDADQPGHECAVTMFAHGKVDSVSVDVPVVLPVASIETAPQVELSTFAPAIENLPLGRAPPAVSSPQV